MALNCSSLPKIKFSLIDLLNKTGSCCTYPMKLLKYCISYFLISIPSIRSSPPVISYNLSIKLTVVDLPHPDSPTRATFLPGSNIRLIPFNIGLLLGSEG